MSELIKELKELLPHFFQGVNLVIAIIALVLIGAYSWWIFAKKSEQEKAKRVLRFGFIVVLVASLALLVHHRLEQSASTFPKGQTGVLVLRIVGDDSNSLRRDLVDSLYSELGKVHMTNIVLRVSDEQLDDSRLGLSAAHQKARSIGKAFNAQLVVWGNRVGEKKFWPRVTIVNQRNSSVLLGERELGVQEIDQSELPPELVHEPVYLASYIAGLAAYERGRYADSLNSLTFATKFIKSNSVESAPLLFFTAMCQLHLVEKQSDPKELLTAAIGELHYAAIYFGKTNSDNWAMTQNNLGIALTELARQSKGTEAVHFLTESVAAFHAAMEIFTREQFPQTWAAAQINLGNALNDQAEQSQRTEAARLLAESVKAYKGALAIYKPDEFPDLNRKVTENLARTEQALHQLQK